MSITNDVREKMVASLKAGDKQSKQVYSNILDAMNKEAKALRINALAEDQEFTVIKRMLNQLNDSIEQCPVSRKETLEGLLFEKNIISGYMPEQMSEDEINAVISGVLLELGIDSPTNKDNGKIMKQLMPKVKGKADGKLVNSLLEKRFN